jgi:hypothetical protein
MGIMRCDSAEVLLEVGSYFGGMGIMRFEGIGIILCGDSVCLGVWIELNILCRHGVQPRSLRGERNKLCT